MKFCIVVVHGLTNNISYDVKLIVPKFDFIGGGGDSKNSVQNREKLEDICSIHIS